MSERIRVAAVTVSDGVAAGERVDRSGDLIAEWADREGRALAQRLHLPDAADAISAALARLADEGGVDVIITTGGTGFTARDHTPEATRAVLERDAPGIAEAIRQAGASVTPYAWLSRGVAGIRGRVLIVNLPGSEGGVRDGLAVLSNMTRHAVQLLRGVRTGEHDRDE